MSHFVVLVVGDSIDHQLEGFDENIEVESYENDLVTEDEIKQFMEYYTKNKVNELKDPAHVKLPFERLYAIYGDEWNGSSWRKNDNDELAEFSTYNPESKWDWYVAGGRWSNMLLLKNGDKVDSAMKSDIDFIGMREANKAAAIKSYRDVKEMFGGEIPQIERSWEDCLADEKLGTTDDKREYYHNQPSMLRLKEVRKENGGKLGFFFDLSDYQCTEDEYAAVAYLTGLRTYAMVKDYEWHEQGQMGWWGMSSNDKDEKVWSDELDRLIAECDDDEILTVVDCHI